MRVGLDITSLLQAHNHGVPVVVESLVREYLGTPSDVDFILTSIRPDRDITEHLRNRHLSALVTKPHIVSRYYDITWRLTNQLDKIKQSPLISIRPFFDKAIQALDPIVNSSYRRRLRRAGVPDVFHHPDYVSTYWTDLKCPHIVTIHDMIPVKLKKLCSDEWLASAQITFRFACEKAARIITYSESSRRDIVEHLNIPLDRVQAIPLAVRHSLLQEVETRTAETVLHKYKLEKQSYFLAVGRLDVLKNLGRLVEAYASLSREPGMKDLKLVLTGPASQAGKGNIQSEIAEIVQRHDLVDQVVFTGHITDAELCVLLRECSSFVFPTLYEGFGLPVLEAMTLGAPVIASNIASVPEVTGDAAILINPYSCDEIAQAMRDVVSDTALARSLVARGTVRAKAFSWPRTAAEYLHLYQEVVDEQAAPRPVLMGVPC